MELFCMIVKGAVSEFCLSHLVKILHTEKILLFLQVLKAN